VHAASVDGPINGPVCATTIVRIAARGHMSPYDSEELTTLIEVEGKEFVVFWSPETAEHDPDYRELGRSRRARRRWSFCQADG